MKKRERKLKAQKKKGKKEHKRKIKRKNLNKRASNSSSEITELHEKSRLKKIAEADANIIQNML